MKKYYYITSIGTLTIIGLQLIYLHSLYTNYSKSIYRQANEILLMALDKEFKLRKNPPQPKRENSKLNIESFHLDIDQAKNRLKGGTTADVLQQLRQDFAIGRGLTLQMSLLDSIYSSEVNAAFYYSLILYDKAKQPIELQGRQDTLAVDYSSKLHPIGTHGYEYVQVKVSIPFIGFIEKEAWPLLLSIIFMMTTSLSLIFLIAVIRRKTKLLNKQEESVNGTIHDLKAPLNSAITLMSYLAMHEKQSSTQKIIELSSQNLKHLIYNIDSLLIIARKNRKKLIINKSIVNVVDLMKYVKVQLDILYQDKPHKILIENPDEETIIANLDKMYIENVLCNLVENALKYADNGVNINMKVVLTSQTLILSVSDNGWGISPSDQKKIFNPFFQVKQSLNNYKKGYGIGLTQAKHIIDEHGGKIKVKSELGKGSCFTVIIPIE